MELNREEYRKRYGTWAGLCPVFLALLLTGCAARTPPQEASATAASGALRGFVQADSTASVEEPASDAMRRVPDSDIQAVQASMAKTMGDKGRLVIPSLGVDVLLQDVSAGTSAYAQQVTDEEDSAAWFDRGSSYGGGCQVFVADHNYQGFSAIEDAVPGETALYWLHDGEVTPYRCLDVFHGQNTGRFIADGGGNDITRDNVGGLALYTCLNDWQHIAIAEFEPVFSVEQGIS